MPINPNIPLSVQQSRAGEYIGQGILQYRKQKAQDASDERANELLELKKQKAARETAEADRKTSLTQTGGFLVSIESEYDKGDPKAIEAAYQSYIDEYVPGSVEAEPVQDLLAVHRRDPQRAGQMAKQIVSQARKEGVISKGKGSQINILIPGEKGIKAGVVNERGQIVHPTTRQPIPGAIKAPSRQETGGPGSLTGSQKGKVEVENIELEKSVTKTIQKAETIKQLVMSPDFRGGITGDASSFVNSGMAQIRQSFGTESIIVGNKLDESRIDPSQISTENLTRFRRSARNNDRFDAAILDLAYTLATIRDPGGRLSDKDVNAAEKTLRSGADRASIIALLGDAQKRAAQDFNTETKIINKRLGKSFPLISLEDVTGKKPVESDDDMANRILQRLNK